MPFTKLKTETKTEEMAERIQKAFDDTHQGEMHNGDVLFEHGQHWIDCHRCGAQWSAVDAVGGDSVDGLAFEQITDGDGFCE